VYRIGLLFLRKWAEGEVRFNVENSFAQVLVGHCAGVASEGQPVNG
jgi:hypothetical protein